MSGNGDGMAAPRDVAEILRRTDHTLGMVLEEVLGAPPRLDVIGQWRLEPPLSGWLAPPLSGEGAVLGRCTSYRMGELDLSRHVAYVDLSRVDPGVAADLESGRVNLGELLAQDPTIEKLDFRFGSDADADAGPFDEVLQTWFDGSRHGPYAWRRYVGRMGGAVALLIVETLPIETWARLLGAEAPVAPREGTG